MIYGTKKFLLLLLLCFLPAALHADTVTGKVVNRTTQKPSAGDDVVLLRMGEGMQEEARVHTDAQGAFSMTLAHPDAQYVLRVLHQGVNYDHTLAGASTVQLEVFDSVPVIPGLSGSLGIAEVQSDGSDLKVTEMYAITNASAPAVAQSGAHNFDVTLPAGAKLDAFMAKRSQGVWVNLAPVQGKQGVYSVDYPLRPGETLFKFSYHLPAAGATTLRLKLAYPIKSFAVMHPPSMKFKALRPQTFISPGTAKGMQIEQAVGGVGRDVPAFVISGVGAIAAQTPAAKPPAAPPANAATELGNVPAVHATDAPVAEDNSSRDAMAVGALLLLVVSSGGFALWKRQRRIAPAKTSGSTPVVQALKDELFQLETERSSGVISEQQYDSARSALNVSLQRALAREKN